jgi:lactoylglutathione lyase
MKLAKAALDVGLYTHQREPMLAFWQNEVGLPFGELLPAGRGVHQLRHPIGDSILKINHVRDPMPATPPSGYRRLSIARPGLVAVRELTDPDGNAVRLLPPGFEGIDQIEIELGVRDVAATAAFYRDALAFEALPDGRFRCGVSLVALRHDPSAPAPGLPMRAGGYRYTTVQVFDVVAEHAEILRRGGLEGAAPVKLGEVAYISFVLDPDGNWIEISQRKSLTGSLASGG